MLEFIKEARKFLNSNKKLFGVIAVAVVIPLTLALVFIRQDIRQRAGGGQIITKLAFQPAIINAMPNAHKSIPMSVLAYDQTGQTIGDGVSYSWGISSTSVTSIGTLSYINNNIATFTPLNDGYGDIYVTATNSNGTYTSSMPVNVGNVTIITPTPTVTTTPAPNVGEIRGMYVGKDGFSTISLPGQKVIIVNQSTLQSYSSTDSPYWSFTNLPPATYSITAENINGYSTENQVCFGCMNQDRFFSGNVVFANVNSTRYLGITFKYTSQITNTPTLTPTPTIFLCPTCNDYIIVGDVNRDNKVGLVDLSILLSYWNLPYTAADFNGDGTVNIVDLSKLLSNWGK